MYRKLFWRPQSSCGRRIVAHCFLALSLPFLGCLKPEPLGPSGGSPTVSVSPQEVTLSGLGSTIILDVTAKTGIGETIPIGNLAFESLQPGVATVNDDGIVTATGLGTAFVTVSYQQVTDTAIIHTVEGPEDPTAQGVTVTPSMASLEVGLTLSLSAAAVSGTGAPDPSPTLAWTSLQPHIATVSSAGLVQSVAEGTALIIVTYGEHADTSVIHVMPKDAPPSPSQITVSPGEATLTGSGNTILLRATGLTETGAAISSSNFTWTSLQPEVATVSDGGLVTSVAEGTALITVAYETSADTATIHVEVGPAPSPPPTNESWDHVLSNVVIQGDLVVPDGEEWLIGPGVQIAGNLRTVGGTIAMRPGSSLKFLGADPTEYVGGGMTYEAKFAQDIGLWIGPQGVLDIRGTPKASWNRTGVDPTWAPDDEYWITPTDIGDYKPRRWFPGDPIPQVDPRVPSAEVINVTRDIVIEGPGHIHIHSGLPQRIEHVQLRRMGVSNDRSDGAVMGRYALHLHFNLDGSRGTVIRGVAAVNSEGTVFVPHSSHGITMTDNVSVNSYAMGFWWDHGDLTHDITVERLLIAGVATPKPWRRVDGVIHGSGRNMVMRNSVVAGTQRASGFSWSNAGHTEPVGSVWAFEDNVAHNNHHSGFRFWLNGGHDHHPTRGIAYRNDLGGIDNGAYKNAHRWTDMLLFDNPLIHHSRSETHVDDGGPARYTNVRVFARSGPALLTGKMLAVGDGQRVEFVDCVLEPGPGPYTPPNHDVTFETAPPILINWENGSNPFLALFRHCGITPEDVEFAGFPQNTEGTSIIIEHEDGRSWEVKQENGQKVVIVR